jgi:DNA-binding NarL/FixJ family response regulator
MASPTTPGVGFALLPGVRVRDMIASMPVTILLVDDDPSFRLLARRALDGSQMAVVGEAGTAAEAARVARALKPDVVLVDVGLPDSDGIALARELSALPWRPRVVLTSVDPDAASPDDVERSGAHGFVPKHDLPGRGLDLLQNA